MRPKNYKMNKVILRILVLVIAFTVGLVQRYWGSNEEHTESTNIKNLTYTYTRHAQCRMGCRFVDKSEVMDVVQNGRMNKRKSNPQGKPCPVVAKEKKTKDQQFVRVVYGDCGGSPKIITVIDLDTDHPCECK